MINAKSVLSLQRPSRLTRSYVYTADRKFDFLPTAGYFNCDDGPGSEEPCILQFDSDYFRCEDGTCVCRAAKCDGNNDCSDGSDEADPECGKMCNILRSAI